MVTNGIREWTEIVGENVRELRKFFRVNQPELAKAVGTSRPVISQLENGETKTSLRTVIAIAIVFSVPPDLLFRKDGYLVITQGRSRQPTLQPLDPDKDGRSD